MELENLYEQRATRLKSLMLDDILSSGPEIFWSPISESAPEVVTRLIEHYLSSFESKWQKEISDADFCLKAIHPRMLVDEKFDYETELAGAHNRLTLALINKFCKPDYSIDWKRLIQSAREKS